MDEHLNLRDLPPVPPVPRPDRLSMTLLRYADRCPRSAYLSLKHRGGPSSHAMDRGSLLHYFHERMLMELVVRGEKSLYAPQEGEDALAAAMEVASLTKVMVEELARERTDLVVPAAEMDHVREMAYHLAVGSDIDPEQVVGVERKFVLDLECGWEVVGKIDALHYLSPTVLSVDDLKTSLAVPSEEKFADSFQTKMYGLLVMFGQPVEKVECGACSGKGYVVQVGPENASVRLPCRECGGFDPFLDVSPKDRTADMKERMGRGTVEVRLDPIGEHLTHIRGREIYPRAKLRPNGRLTSREAVYSRTDLADFRFDVERTAQRITVGLESGKWPAVPDRDGEGYCNECPASLECPLPKHLRNFAGSIQSHDEAAEALAWAMRTKQNVSATEKEVKNWSKVNGPVRVGGTVYEHEVSHSRALKRRGRESDWDGLQGAVEEAVTFGSPFDVADWVREQVRTVFKGRPVEEGAVSKEELTDDDAGSDKAGSLDERFGAAAPF